MKESVYLLIIVGLPLMVAIILHEWAYGYAAKVCGDPTAWRFGRLSLNPMRHIDLMGTLLLPFFLSTLGGPVVGYAKPVPIDEGYFQNKRYRLMSVAIAGPVMSLIVSLVSLLLIVLLLVWVKSIPLGVVQLFMASFKINIMLACFNLLPIPPLDGGLLLIALLGNDQTRGEKVELIGYSLLLALLVISLLISVFFQEGNLSPLSYVHALSAMVERFLLTTLYSNYFTLA